MVRPPTSTVTTRFHKRDREHRRYRASRDQLRGRHGKSDGIRLRGLHGTRGHRNPKKKGGKTCVTTNTWKHSRN